MSWIGSKRSDPGGTASWPERKLLVSGADRDGHSVIAEKEEGIPRFRSERQERDWERKRGTIVDSHGWDGRIGDGFLSKLGDTVAKMKKSFSLGRSEKASHPEELERL
jgi:hypothetical protein